MNSLLQGNAMIIVLGHGCSRSSNWLWLNLSDSSALCSCMLTHLHTGMWERIGKRIKLEVKIVKRTEQGGKIVLVMMIKEHTKQVMHNVNCPPHTDQCPGRPWELDCPHSQLFQFCSSAWCHMMSWFCPFPAHCSPPAPHGQGTTRSLV